MPKALESKLTDSSAIRPMRYSFPCLVVLLVGCYVPPEGTRDLTDREERLARITADLLRVPEECRDYSTIGIYQAGTQDEFYAATTLGPFNPGSCSRAMGECPDPNARLAKSQIIYTVNSNHWDSVIVVESIVVDRVRLSTSSVALTHEFHHHFNDCQWGAEAHGHDGEHWFGDFLARYIWTLVRNGQAPVFLPYLR